MRVAMRMRPEKRPKPPTGANVYAASASRADVQSAIDVAAAGDVVHIPSGTATWSTQVVIAKAITLRGAGVGSTVITDGMDKTLGGDARVMLKWTLQSTGQHRLCHLTINGGTNVDGSNVGIVRIYGASSITTPNFRCDHVEWSPTKTSALMLYDTVGLVDHCEFILSDTAFGIYVFHQSWQGVGDYGDNSWAQPPNYGSAAFLFVEDCILRTTWDYQHYACDGWNGQRVVYRYNTFYRTTWANHGTESGGRQRGARAAEIYNNTFEMDHPDIIFPDVIGSRGGGALIHGNDLLVSGGAFVGQMTTLNYLRVNQSFSPWGQCDGSSAWDENQSGLSGYKGIDQTGAGSGDLLSGESPTAAWPNQVSEPNYLWGNTRNGSYAAGDNGGTAVAHIALDRDFIRSEAPDYTPYTYPHPLQAGS
jgi:hypothetical protein